MTFNRITSSSTLIGGCSAHVAVRSADADVLDWANECRTRISANPVLLQDAT